MQSVFITNVTNEQEALGLPTMNFEQAKPAVKQPASNDEADDEVLKLPTMNFKGKDNEDSQIGRP